MNKRRFSPVFLACVLGFILPGAGWGQRGQNFDSMFDAMDQMEQSFDSVFDEISLEEAYYIGRSVAARILTAYRPYDNPGMTAYLNKICQAITINSPQPVLFNGYHVMILDSTEINAMATPGGHIFISRALVEAAGSEDMLAAVIAHEVAHIQFEHGLESIKLYRMTESLNQAAQSGAARSGNASFLDQQKRLFGQTISETLNTLTLNGYSQNQEFEADSMAQLLLAKAGYNPRSLIDLLRILATVQGGHPGGFNVTHPAPSLRISNAEQTIGIFRAPDTRSARTARFRALVK